MLAHTVRTSSRKRIPASIHANRARLLRSATPLSSLFTRDSTHQRFDRRPSAPRRATSPGRMALQPRRADEHDRPLALSKVRKGGVRDMKEPVDVPVHRVPPLLRRHLTHVGLIDVGAGGVRNRVDVPVLVRRARRGKPSPIPGRRAPRDAPSTPRLRFESRRPLPSLPASLWRYVIASFTLAAANSRAIALPIPPLPPTTSATPSGKSGTCALPKLELHDLPSRVAWEGVEHLDAPEVP